MLIRNALSEYRTPLDPQDARSFGTEGAARAERFLEFRENHKPTPLYALPGLAESVVVASIHIKDESARLDVGSFKALGASYAAI